MRIPLRGLNINVPEHLRQLIRIHSVFINRVTIVWRRSLISDIDLPP